MAKSNKQQQGIDYDKIFTPITHVETIRLIIFLSAQNNWKIFQIDMKLAFLNGHLEEEVYVEQPMCYVMKRHEKKVPKLKKKKLG